MDVKVIHQMKKAFTLIEILIVVAILGILAAIVIPTFSGHIQEAKEAAAKDNLRILRNAIELYASQHNNVPPGYPNNDHGQTPSWLQFVLQIQGGHYINTIPENPFNGSFMFKIIGNAAQLPAEATATKQYGWIYKPATKTIRVNLPGKDSKGMRYYDY